MAEKPLVSIITPSYNQAAFLDETIRSVLSQDYANIEYIVVDGGSTDGSVEIIKRYADRIAKWVSEPDEGQSHAINKGFRMATGDIVAWLNSDDLYFPDAVSTAVKRFVEHADLGLFYGHCVFIDRDGAFVRYFTEVEPYDEFRLRNCTDFIMQPTTFFKRETLFDIGLLDTRLHYCMDWDLWCRFAESGCGVLCEPRLIAATRVYAETKTMGGSRARLDEIRRVLRRHRTGLWPHAHCGFRATEIRQRLAQRNTPFVKKAALAIFLFLMRLGNARNILYDQLRQKHLYGIRRRSRSLLRTARICWPIYFAANEVQLTLCSRAMSKGGRQKVNVRIAGKEQEPVSLDARDKGCTFSFRIPESVNRSHVIDIELQFDKTNLLGIAASLDKVLLV